MRFESLMAAANLMPAAMPAVSGQSRRGHGCQRQIMRRFRVGRRQWLSSNQEDAPSAPRGARTSTSTAWWRSARRAMPKQMPPTRAAAWSSPLGNGCFTTEVIRGADKWLIQA
jgi:hypothetical protein